MPPYKGWIAQPIRVWQPAAGSFAGVYHGIDVWPVDWVERIEYHDHLLHIAKGLVG
jgi:hypothetical protein